MLPRITAHEMSRNFSLDEVNWAFGQLAGTHFAASRKVHLEIFHLVAKMSKLLEQESETLKWKIANNQVRPLLNDQHVLTDNAHRDIITASINKAAMWNKPDFNRN